MAMVNISQKLVCNAVDIANDQFSARRIRVETEFKLPMTGDEIYDLTFGRWYNGMMSMPKEFFHWSSELTVSSVGNQSCNLTLLLGAKKPFPTNFPDQPTFRKESTYGPSSRIRLYSDEQWQPLEDAIKTRAIMIEEIQEQKQTFTDTLKTLLSKHTTLASALKEWPPLWDYLTDEVKQRHSAPTVRNKKVVADAGPEPEVNTATLTALATLNKITL